MENQKTAIFVLMGIIIIAALVIFILDSNRNSDLNIENETGKRYIGQSLEQCETLRFQCDESTKYFLDDEGCGCEKIQITMNQLNYFTNQMWIQGVENLGGAMPIEGFTPDLYLGAFLNMKESDFNGAEAYGGTWIYKDDELIFQRDDSQEVTSAEGTVVVLGMLTVLNNLADRLNIEPTSQENIDLIIAEIE